MIYLIHGFILDISREDFLLGLLEKFKNKLHNAQQSNQEKNSDDLESEDEDDWYVYLFYKTKI